MLNYNDAFYNLLQALKEVYDEHEAAAIAHEVLEDLTGMNKMQRLMYKDELLSQVQSTRLEHMKTDLLKARPLQYVLGYAYFMGKKFKVNEHVLIPRPETEELVELIIKDTKEKPGVTIIDIGTGSGCIPIALKAGLPQAHITACDVSPKALTVAKENASALLHTDLNFITTDFLNGDEREKLSRYDIIVSNPPYIPETEKDNLHANVREHEPHLALFAPGSDPLIFYKAIAKFGKTHLNKGGTIYCELHADHAELTGNWFRQSGYGMVQVIRDMHGNLRMLKASL